MQEVWRTKTKSVPVKNETTLNRSEALKTLAAAMHDTALHTLDIEQKPEDSAVQKVCESED